MTKITDVYFVLTEEGLESMGKTPCEALTNYLAAGSGGENELEWIGSVLDGKSEIECIVKMTRAEYREWLKTAIEV